MKKVVLFATLLGASPLPWASGQEGGGSMDDGLRMARKQARLHALTVLELDAGALAGASSRLTATYLQSPGAVKFPRIRFNQEVGEIMGGTLPEIAKLMEVRHGSWIRDGVVELAFEERQRLKDGNSAGLATGLLVESLVTGHELDPDFACTGALNVDGSVQPVGGIVAKLRAAHRAGCTHAAIPHANRYALSDLTVLGEADILAKMQVFLVEDIDRAWELALAEKPEAVAASIEAFGGLQAAFAAGGVMRTVRSREGRAAIEAVLERTPEHASARLMQAAALGRLPRRLSLNGSLEELQARFVDLLGAVDAGPKDGSAGTLAAFDDATREFRRLRGKIDPRTVAVGTAMGDFARTCRETFEQAAGATPARQASLRRSLGAALFSVMSEIGKLGDDPELVEDLLELE